MSDRRRYPEFKGWLAHLERLNNGGVAPPSVKIEKREAGETIAEWNARQLRIINRNKWNDNDPHPRDPYNMRGPHRGRGGE